MFEVFTEAMRMRLLQIASEEAPQQADAAALAAVRQCMREVAHALGSQNDPSGSAVLRVIYDGLGALAEVIEAVDDKAPTWSVD